MGQWNRLRLLHCAVLLSVVLHLAACPLLIAGAAGGGAAGAVVSAKESREEHHSAITYVGTVLANVVYFPAKVVFAGLGAATSGVAYVVTTGSSNTSRSIWNASVNGDYVLTPRMIEGRQPIHFSGSSGDG